MKKLFIGLLLIGTISAQASIQEAGAESPCRIDQFLLMIEDDYIPGIEQCIKDGAVYINQRITNAKETPLMYASILGKEKSVKKLIELGANVHIKSTENNTALHFAPFMKKGINKTDREVLSIVKMLVSNQADAREKNSQNKTPLDIAISNEFFESAKYLLLSISPE